MDGFKKCNVCGVEFALIAINHYVARDCGKTGGVLASFNGSTEEMLYDAFDCPHCGCQNIMQERKRTLIRNCDMVEDAEIAEDEAEAPFSEV